MDGTNLAGVYVEVGADLSELGAQLQGAVKEASDAGEQIGRAVEEGVKASGGIEEIGNEIHAIGPQLEELGAGFAQMGKGLLVGGAAMTEIGEHFVEVAEEALTFTGRIQFASAALTTFFDSGQKAAGVLEELKEIEKTTIFDDAQLAGAAQQLAALGMAAEKIPETMKAIALAAEAVGGSTASLDSATMAISRIQATGQLSQRALVQLGLSWDDLAKTMGTSAESAKNQLTKGLEDADAVVGIVTASINAKMKGLADTTANTLPVALNQLKAAWDEILGKLGQSLAPVALQIANGLKYVLDQVGQLIDIFNLLPGPLKEGIIILGALALAIGPVTLALGAFLFAGGEILESLPKIVEGFGALKAVMTGTEIAQAGAAVAEVGTAAESAAVGVTGLAAAASTAALAFGGLIALGVGATIGAWLGNIKAVQDAFDRLFEATGITNLISRFEGADQAQKSFLESTLALETALKKQGITVDGTGLSIEQYAQKLRDAAKAQSDMNVAIDSGPFDHLSKNAKDLISNVQGLEANLQKAKEAVVELKSAGAGDWVILAAQNKVKEALQALGDKSEETAKRMAEAARETQKEYVAAYDLIAKGPFINESNFTQVIADITAYKDQLTSAGTLTQGQMDLINSVTDSATKNYQQDMANIQKAIASGFKFDQAIAQINKMIESLQASKNASSAATKSIIADLENQLGVLTRGATEWKSYAANLALMATQTQKLSDVDAALATATDKMNANVTFTGKVFDDVVPKITDAGVAGTDLVRVIQGGVSPAFETLADAAAKAGMSIQDFQAKTQIAALDARAAMGDIGAASDSMVARIKIGQEDSIRSLQAALGAYGTLRDEVNNGSASQAELARAIQMVQSAASAANIDLANVGSTMALTAEQQQKLTDALHAGGNAFKDYGAAAKSAGDQIGQLGRDMNAYFDAADRAFNNTDSLKNAMGPSVSVGSGQVVVQHLGAGGNVGGGVSQNIQVVTPSVFTGKAPGATMAETNEMNQTGETLNQLRARKQQEAADAKAAAATKLATDATAAATIKATELQGKLTDLAAQMKTGGDRAKVLSNQMEGLSRQGLENTAEYRQMSDELNGIYTLNGQLNDQYESIQTQLGQTATGLDTFGASISSVGDALTAASRAAAGFADLGDNTTPPGVTPGTGGGAMGSGGHAGFADLGPLVNMNGMLVPGPGPTINLNMNGAIITSQGAANELFTTAVDILKRDTGLKL